MFALLAILTAAAAADAPLTDNGGWVRASADRDGEYFYAPASVRRKGQVVRVKMRLSVHAMAGVYLAEQSFDCRKQTVGLLAATERDADGKVLRHRSVPPDRVQPEPIFAGSSYEPWYRLLCPSGQPLAKLPELPPIVATPPGDPKRKCLPCKRKD